MFSRRPRRAASVSQPNWHAPSDAALLAATQVYHPSRPQSSSSLSSAAAAAALKNAQDRPPNPNTVIGNIPTRRMLERRGSYSSASSVGADGSLRKFEDVGGAGNLRASVLGRPAIERRSSTGSMTDRTFRVTKPSISDGGVRGRGTSEDSTERDRPVSNSSSLGGTSGRRTGGGTTSSRTKPAMSGWVEELGEVVFYTSPSSPPPMPRNVVGRPMLVPEIEEVDVEAQYADEPKLKRNVSAIQSRMNPIRPTATPPITPQPKSRRSSNTSQTQRPSQHNNMFDKRYDREYHQHSQTNGLHSIYSSYPSSVASIDIGASTAAYLNRQHHSMEEKQETQNVVKNTSVAFLKPFTRKKFRDFNPPPPAPTPPSSTTRLGMYSDRSGTSERLLRVKPYAKTASATRIAALKTATSQIDVPSKPMTPPRDPGTDDDVEVIELYSDYEPENGTSGLKEQGEEDRDRAKVERSYEESNGFEVDDSGMFATPSPMSRTGRGAKVKNATTNGKLKRSPPAAQMNSETAYSDQESSTLYSRRDVERGNRANEARKAKMGWFCDTSDGDDDEDNHESVGRNILRSHKRARREGQGMEDHEMDDSSATTEEIDRTIYHQRPSLKPEIVNLYSSEVEQGDEKILGLHSVGVGLGILHAQESEDPNIVLSGDEEAQTRQASGHRKKMRRQGVHPTVEIVQDEEEGGRPPRHHAHFTPPINNRDEGPAATSKKHSPPPRSVSPGKDGLKKHGTGAISPGSSAAEGGSGPTTPVITRKDVRVYVSDTEDEETKVNKTDETLEEMVTHQPKAPAQDPRSFEAETDVVAKIGSDAPAKSGISGWIQRNTGISFAGKQTKTESTVTPRVEGPELGFSVDSAVGNPVIREEFLSKFSLRNRNSQTTPSSHPHGERKQTQQPLPPIVYNISPPPSVEDLPGAEKESPVKETVGNYVAKDVSHGSMKGTDTSASSALPTGKSKVSTIVNPPPLSLRRVEHIPGEWIDSEDKSPPPARALPPDVPRAKTPPSLHNDIPKVAAAATPDASTTSSMTSSESSPFARRTGEREVGISPITEEQIRMISSHGLDSQDIESCNNTDATVGKVKKESNANGIETVRGALVEAAPLTQARSVSQLSVKNIGDDDRSSISGFSIYEDALEDFDRGNESDNTLKNTTETIRGPAFGKATAATPALVLDAAPTAPAPLMQASLQVRAPPLVPSSRSKRPEQHQSQQERKQKQPEQFTQEWERNSVILLTPETEKKLANALPQQRPPSSSPAQVLSHLSHSSLRDKHPPHGILKRSSSTTNSIPPAQQKSTPQAAKKVLTKRSSVPPFPVGLSRTISYSSDSSVASESSFKRKYSKKPVRGFASLRAREAMNERYMGMRSTMRSAETLVNQNKVINGAPKRANSMTVSTKIGGFSAGTMRNSAPSISSIPSSRLKPIPTLRTPVGKKEKSKSSFSSFFSSSRNKKKQKGKIVSIASTASRFDNSSSGEDYTLHLDSDKGSGFMTLRTQPQSTRLHNRFDSDSSDDELSLLDSNNRRLVGKETLEFQLESEEKREEQVLRLAEEIAKRKGIRLPPSQLKGNGATNPEEEIVDASGAESLEFITSAMGPAEAMPITNGTEEGVHDGTIDSETIRNTILNSGIGSAIKPSKNIKTSSLWSILRRKPEQKPVAEEGFTARIRKSGLDSPARRDTPLERSPQELAAQRGNIARKETLRKYKVMAAEKTVDGKHKVGLRNLFGLK